MIESRAIRRLVLAHSVLSFFYNTMISGARGEPRREREVISQGR